MERLLITSTAPAGVNRIYSDGIDAQGALMRSLTPDGGFYTLTAQCRYWDFGISESEHGYYAVVGECSFAVNPCGYIYSEAGTVCGDNFIKALYTVLHTMQGGKQNV